MAGECPDPFEGGVLRNNRSCCDESRPESVLSSSFEPKASIVPTQATECWARRERSTDFCLISCTGVLLDDSSHQWFPPHIAAWSGNVKLPNRFREAKARVPRFSGS